MYENCVLHSHAVVHINPTTSICKKRWDLLNFKGNTGKEIPVKNSLFCHFGIMVGICPKCLNSWENIFTKISSSYRSGRVTDPFVVQFFHFQCNLNADFHREKIAPAYKWHHNRKGSWAPRTDHQSRRLMIKLLELLAVSTDSYWK